MRFKIGDKVEVLNRREDPTSSWWCAEIMSGNGHNYYVRYDRDLPDVGSAVERVPRKAIRPCPPSVKGRLDWVPGDFVEVLNNFSWKHAKIIMFSRREYFVVRLLGSSTELSVRSSNIRLRQCWQDNKWVVFRKDSAKCSDKTTNVLSKEKFISEEPQIVDDQFLDKKNISFEDTSQIFTVSVKKRLRSSHPLERCNGAFRKKRAVEKDGCPQGIFAWNSTTWEKVDAVASPQTMFGEKYMHSSLINRNTGNFEANQGVGIANADGGHFSRLMLEGSDAESVSSSVGSCSIIKSPCRSMCHPFYGMGQYMESHHNISEASATLGRETSIPTNEALAQDIHSLGLHAYRCTLSALYASGPISWEQEALLTNLRLMLHISNDEHLMELKNLVSSQTNDFVR